MACPLYENPHLKKSKKSNKSEISGSTPKAEVGDDASQSYGTSNKSQLAQKDSEKDPKSPLISTKVSGLSIETCLKRYSRQNKPKTEAEEKGTEKAEKNEKVTVEKEVDKNEEVQLRASDDDKSGSDTDDDYDSES
jgi:hypothetical protein